MIIYLQHQHQQRHWTLPTYPGISCPFYEDRNSHRTSCQTESPSCSDTNAIVFQWRLNVWAKLTDEKSVNWWRGEWDTPHFASSDENMFELRDLSILLNKTTNTSRNCPFAKQCTLLNTKLIKFGNMYISGKSLTGIYQVRLSNHLKGAHTRATQPSPEQDLISISRWVSYEVIPNASQPWAVQKTLRNIERQPLLCPTNIP